MFPLASKRVIVNSNEHFQSPHLGFENHSLIKKKNNHHHHHQGPLGKWLLLGWGREYTRWAWSLLLALENTEALNKKQRSNLGLLMGRRPAERTLAGQSGKNSSRKITVLDYNTKNQINIHGSIVKEINDQINKWRRDKAPLQKNSK